MWDEILISIPKFLLLLLPQVFHPTLYWAFDYSSMAIQQFASSKDLFNYQIHVTGCFAVYHFWNYISKRFDSDSGTFKTAVKCQALENYEHETFLFNT